jgi:hypothetical protein
MFKTCDLKIMVLQSITALAARWRVVHLGGPTLTYRHRKGRALPAIASNGHPGIPAAHPLRLAVRVLTKTLTTTPLHSSICAIPYRVPCASNGV